MTTTKIASSSNAAAVRLRNSSAKSDSSERFSENENRLSLLRKIIPVHAALKRTASEIISELCFKFL